MTTKMMENRMKKLQALEADRKNLDEQIEALKSEIQTEMGNDETYETPLFIIRWTNTVASRFDSKQFKADHAKLYDAYVKQTQSRRFSYSVR